MSTGDPGTPARSERSAKRSIRGLGGSFDDGHAASGRSRVTLKIDDVLAESCRSVYHLLGDGTMQDEEDHHDGKHHNSQVHQLLSHFWRSLSAYLLQEVSLGRSVSLAPLGVFSPPAAGPEAAEAKAAFQALVWHDSRVERRPAREQLPPGQHAGPVTKAKFDLVSKMLGWPPRIVEEVSRTVLQELVASLGQGSDASLDFPGLGMLVVRRRAVSFDAPSGERPPSRGIGRPKPPKGVTVGHAVFGDQRLGRSASGAALLGRPSTLPRLEHLPLGGTLPALEQSAPLVMGMTKSMSTPLLSRPERAESWGINFSEAPCMDLQVTLPKSLMLGGARRTPAPLLAAEIQDPRRVTRLLPGADQLFPPLLDRCSRMRSALFREEVDIDMVSNVVASNYSARSALLRIDPEIEDPVGSLIRWKQRRIGGAPQVRGNDGTAADTRAVDWTAEWPKILEDSELAQELKEVGMSPQEFCRILSRYKYYTEGGVPSEVLAPYNKNWLDHALFLLELDNDKLWHNTNYDQRCQVVENARKDILKGYIRAAKSAVVDYALLDARCRDRIDIPFTPTPKYEWGGVPFTVPDIGTCGGPPAEWRAGLAAARSSLLGRCVQNSQTALRLRLFWQDNCESVRFLTCPAKHMTPKDILGFHTDQVAVHDNAIRTLCECWGEVVRIVSEEPMYLPSDASGEGSVCSGSAADAGRQSMLRAAGVPSGVTPQQMEARFFEAVAALLSQMAREVIEQTLTEYVSLFERFAADPLHHEAVKKLRGEDSWQDELLVNRLVVVQANDESFIRFKHDSELVLQRVLMPYSMCTTSLKEFRRPDAHFRDNPARAMLWEVHEVEAHIKKGYDRVERITSMNLANAEKIYELYEPFRFLLTEDASVMAFMEDPSKSRDQYDAYVARLRNAMDECSRLCPPEIRTQLIRIDAAEVNDKLMKCGKECVAKLLKGISTRSQERCSRLVKSFENLNKRIMAVPKGEEELVDLEAAVEAAQTVDFPRLLEEYEDIKAWLFLAFGLDHLLVDADYEAIWAASLWKGYASQINDRLDALSGDRMRIEGGLTERRGKFEEELKSLLVRISKFREKGSVRVLEDNLETINDIKKKLQECQAELEEINEKEVLLGEDATEFEDLPKARESLDPYDKLWHLVAQHQKSSQKWMKTPLFSGDVKPDEVETDVNAMWRLSFKLKATFEQDGATLPAQLAEKIKKDLDGFKENVPLLHALCNPGLRDRHWKEMSNETGFLIEPEPTTTLEKMLAIDLLTYINKISEISDSAGREYQIESGLSTQKGEWSPVNMEFKDWGETGTYIVAGSSIDEIQTLLDDHVIKTQTMKGSPYAKEFQKALNEWEEFLKTVQEIIDVWLKVQGVWLYLEPIFSSDDIMQQMPTEGRLFREVDAIWREIMQRCKDEPAALRMFAADGFLAEMETANEKLEVVQKGLNDYLETKRLFFPRFFFLSNDNLLEILSETKDPRRVNAHTKKAFEGIQSLSFEDDLKISGMISPEKELCPLVNFVDPVAANGAVEVWLVQVEEAMIESVRAISMQSREDYTTKSFVDWLQDWPGQVVIGIFNLYWTADVTFALANEANAGLVRYAQVLEGTLSDIVELVRREIPANVRFTLEALVVIFVHGKDTIIELRDQGCSKPDDFDWLVQLRYFIEENPDKPGVDDMFVRITNSFLGYAYEYIGNCNRLVVTPLTDRCYRTCCGALHLLYGAAPEGPAGTGKTETVKDLAKALARFCVVFNCSDELDVQAMAKFFKGLASSGGWACFDEFNRIDPEVLSVVAQQVLQIQNAVKARLHFFEFEGTACLPIKWTCNSFITMNPGYAGRAELPDNLKALFRTVAMMVPDYGMIAEIKLYSYGYNIARSLAQKIVTTYKLCSEQLSSQKHYDYGMRAVFSVLVAAGNLKRKFPEESEEILMLRSICDVNLAKFLAFDVPLFKGITTDLFPGVVLPTPDFGALTSKLEYFLAEEHCQPHPYFIEKIIQFYECHVVRHSVMLVGMPFSGKTTALRCLQSTLSDLAISGIMHPGCIVHMQRLNPKSIPPNCLYGSFDEVSHEWADGIVAVLFRDMGRNQTEERKWLVFDGPIDAVWIENMNTVMDENKKLCLNSGEIIAMSANMRTIMEPADVAEASPATISRNGMVYFEPHLMGIDPLLEKFMKGSMPEGLDDDEKQEVANMVGWLLKPCLHFVREDCQEVSPTQDQNLVQSFMLMLVSHISDALKLDHFRKSDGLGDDGVRKNIINMIDCFCVWCCIWTIGGVCVTASRPLFNTFFRSIITGKSELVKQYKKLQPELPERGTVFDWVYSAEHLAWKGWLETVEPQQIKAGSSVESLVVQTLDNVRYRYVLNHSIKHRIKLLFCGPTGTGKTAYMQQALYSLDKDNFMQIIMGFSAQTKCAQTQDLVDAKLDRRRKGVYGPPMGKTCVLMVDDLNMPNKETYGAQPPIEILRQMIDANAYAPTGGWYERKDVTHPFRGIMDVLLFASMGPPGGGRTFITARMLGHLFLVSFPLLDDENMTKIFSTILDWKFAADNYPEDIQALSKKIVGATLDVYKSSVAELLPTPLKVHYTFNLRDFAKIIFGTLLLKKNDCDGPGRHVRLWVHEVWRVIGDRLTDNADRQWMLTKVSGLTKTVFAMGWDDLMKHLDLDGDGKVSTLEEARGLIFGDMMSEPAAPNRPYSECADVAALQARVEGHLENYNMQSTKKMDLVCFLYMLEHLSRVARVIKNPGGNALLVGVGGSGRQSCTKLASFLADYLVYQVELTRGYDQSAFREDLKKLLTNSGGKGEKYVFLFTDSQIKSEGFVEDLNNLLNAGEVPNLFAADERVQLCEMVRAAARSEGKAPEGTPTQLYGYFVERCRAMLAIVLCFSPIGDAWRSRLRQFPSLVNCCTLDWFTEWPADALTAVAKKFLGEVDMEAKVRASCVEMCSLFHSSTTALAQEFREKLKRIYYATPTSFLELIQTFKSLLGAKRKQVSDLMDKYKNGVDKILTTEESVEGMKVELIALQPKLVAKNIEVQSMMVQVTSESEKTNKVKELVAADEAVAAVQAGQAEEVKADVEGDLAEALPALKEALSALDTLTAKDIGEVKAMGNPPAAVKLVLQSVCIMKGIKPARIKDETGKMVEDYWGPSKLMVGDKDFLRSLQTYDKDSIAPATIKKIEPFLDLEDFQPDRVKRVSLACGGICCWVRAMHTYDRVAKVVGPKKEALAVAEAELAVVMGKLNDKRAELQKVLDALAALEAQLQNLNDEKANLAYQVDLCEKKLIRAEALIESLGGEKGRWTINAKKLDGDYVNLTGDVIVASGLIAYLGAFTPDFRDKEVKSWAVAARQRSIPGSEEFSLETVLGEPVKIRNWTICGLPNDAFSIENGIVVDKSRRWPLCIDPQGQANKWIKKMEAAQKIVVKKFTDSDYMRRMEGAISFGTPMLIENVLEETDPAIEPVLLKQTYAKGTTLMIKIGDSILEWSKTFKLYLTTKMRNPHYLPEVAVKVTLLNFMITQVGLQDQLLNTVVEKERPELAEEKARLVVEGAENKAALEEAENRILHVLKTSSGNILEDESAIVILSESKTLANKIAAKQQIAEATEAEIDEARQGYVPVAFQAAVLFFCVADLANIDPMYQYSLPFFIGLFLSAIDKAEKTDVLVDRITILSDTFRYTLYCNICRSLFEKHKTLFSFLLTMRGLLATGDEDFADYRFLLTGGVSLEDPPAKPAEWVPNACWGELFRLSKVHERYANFHMKFGESLDIWKEVYDATTPMKIMKDEATRPHMLNGLNDLQDILVLRCVRPDRVVPAVMDFITVKLGEKFVTPPPFDLAGSYADSSSMSPLIFILSPGSDPGSTLFKFAEEKNKDVASISLGQGQGPKAEKLMDKAREDGTWVLLQNCHLATSWMPKLDRLLEEMDPKKTNQGFRLWLTSYPSNKFPVALLQNGVKMTNEPPQGLRANMTGSYLMDPVPKDEYFEACSNPRTFKRYVFNLCFFHAVIQERRLFGPLGWNIRYEFTENDLRISARQLLMFLDDYPDDTPVKALNYLTGECNYGGRVTEGMDRRLMMTLLGSYYTLEALEDGYEIFNAGEGGPVYKQPPDGLSHEDHLKHINSLPLITPPGVFGFHENANLTKEMGETYTMMAELLLTAAQGGGGGGANSDQVVGEIAKDVLNRVPPPWNVAKVQETYPTKYEESMNTVLAQELTRFNGLISSIVSSLKDIQKAIKGLLLMSSALEGAYFQIFDGQTPALWIKYSYPSLKPLGGYVNDLVERLKFFQMWIDAGAPVLFWFSGIYFQQAFTTGASQNFARKYHIPIDTLSFDFYFPKEQHPTTRPEDGVYTYGVFFEACKWDWDTWQIGESDAKVLFVSVPVIQLVPVEKSKMRVYASYECPCYKVSTRKGVLSTTGHSTNFVMPIKVPSDQPEAHWIKRGVAMLTSLDT